MFFSPHELWIKSREVISHDISGQQIRSVIEGVVMPSTNTSCSPSFVSRESFRLNPVFKEGKVKVLHIWKTHEKV